MYRKLALYLLSITIFVSCYQPQRDCKDFKDGEFTFSTSIDDIEVTTKFIRQGGLEIDYFNGKVDSSTVRWVNDCEYIVKKINPKSKAEEKSVHMKILTTTNNSYTFEYSLVGENKKSKGTAIKTN